MIKRLLVITLFLSFGGLRIYAQQESYSDELTGTMHVSDVVTITEAKYSQLLSDPSWTSEFSDLNVNNYIELRYDPEVPITASGTQSTSVGISVDWWDASGVLSTFTTTLGLGFNSDGTQLVKDRSTYYFTGAHKMKITVTSITGANIGNLILNGDIRIDRRYLFSQAAITSSDIGVNIVGTSSDYYEFYWPVQEGADKYELEWVYVNDYTTTASSYISSSLLNYDFYLNSTLVEVLGNTYRIPRIFDHGYLLFRVRGVGKWEPSFEYRKDGQWSTNESGDIASFISAYPTQVITITSEYEGGGANWKHSVHYTEEGKRFESVAFADGLGRVRQQVAHNTETQQAVVSDVYYDYHGRPAVSDLPTPVDGEQLKHYPNFNIAQGTSDVYGPDYFDAPISVACPPIAYGFEQSAGAGKYYSVNNPDQAEENQYIPDANGFPFARTLYTPDETGRLKRQGAYGEDFQVGLGHETKFYYVIPTQPELDKLFGTDVGWNTHYQKKVTMDPNGQIYMEYYDMAGRVVASGLAGNSPASLDALEDNGAVNLPVVLFNGPSNQIITDGITAQYEVDQFFDSNGDVVVNYGFTPQQLTDICQGGTICFDCFYDLTLSIEDECGNVLYSLTREINGSDIENLTGGSVDNECDNPSAFSLQTTLALQAGQYHFSKTLGINQDVIDQYWCLELSEGDCMPNYYTIFNDLYTAATFDNCNTDDEDNGFDPTVLAPPNPTCDDYFDMMASDMSPGGQYARYDNNIPAPPDASSYALSILNTSNSLGANWQDMSITYLDDLGATAYVSITYDGTTYTPAVNNTTSLLIATSDPNQFNTIPQNLTNLADFLSAFQNSWANALVPFHPEYCYYNFCTSVGADASNTYDADMCNIIQHTIGCADGYYDPLGLGILSSQYSITSAFSACAATPNLDPFFINIGTGTGIGSAYFSDMQSDMTNYSGTGYDIFEIAIWIALGKNIPIDSIPNYIKKFRIDNCTIDMVWLNYVKLYQAAKKKYYYLAQEDYVLTNGCYNGCFGNGSFSTSDPVPYFPGPPVPSSTPSFTAYPGSVHPQWCDVSSLFTNKIPRFSGNAYLTMLDGIGSGSSSFTDLFNSTTANATDPTTGVPSLCSENVTNWISQLTGCGFTTAQQSSVSAALQTLCESIGTPDPSCTLSSLDFYTEVDNILTTNLGAGYESNLCSPFLLDSPGFVTADNAS